MTLYIGSTVRIAPVIRDAVLNENVDPASLQFELTRPDRGTIIYSYPSAEVQREGVGLYALEAIVNVEGRWWYRVVSTGAGAGVLQGHFDVLPRHT